MKYPLVRAALSALIMLSGALGAAHVAAQDAAKPAAFADEDRDWGVAPTPRLRTTDYHGPTPRGIPGGRVVTTNELKTLLEKEPRPYLIDVLGGGVHRTLAGAFWMLASGAGDMGREEEKRFLEAIAKFAGGDRAQRRVVREPALRIHAEEHHRAALVAAGYTNVMWYRGGIAAWRTAGLPMAQSDPFFWKE